MLCLNMPDSAFVSPGDIPQAIALERQRLEFRPTVMAVAHTMSNHLLMVQSPNEGSGFLWLLQGGVEPHEDTNPTLAVRREIEEEVAGVNVLYVGACLGGFRNTVPRPRSEFTRGKLYIIYDVLLHEQCNPRPIPSETAAAHLLSYSDCSTQLKANCRDERRVLKADYTQAAVDFILGQSASIRHG